MSMGDIRYGFAAGRYFLDLAIPRNSPLLLWLPRLPQYAVNRPPHSPHDTPRPPRRARRVRDLCHFECGLFQERESNPIRDYLVRCSSLRNSTSRDITSVFWSNLYLSVPG